MDSSAECLRSGNVNKTRAYGSAPDKSDCSHNTQTFSTSIHEKTTIESSRGTKSSMYTVARLLTNQYEPYIYSCTVHKILILL